MKRRWQKELGGEDDGRGLHTLLHFPIPPQNSKRLSNCKEKASLRSWWTWRLPMLPASSSKPTTSHIKNNMMVTIIKCCWGWCWGWCWEGQGPLSCTPISPANVGGWQLEWSTDSLRNSNNLPASQAMQCASVIAGYLIVVASTIATMASINTHKQMLGWLKGESWRWRWTWTGAQPSSASEGVCTAKGATSWASPIGSSSPFSKCTPKETALVGGLNDSHKDINVPIWPYHQYHHIILTMFIRIGLLLSWDKILPSNCANWEYVINKYLSWTTRRFGLCYRVSDAEYVHEALCSSESDRAAKTAAIVHDENNTSKMSCCSKGSLSNWPHTTKIFRKEMALKSTALQTAKVVSSLFLCWSWLSVFSSNSPVIIFWSLMEKVALIELRAESILKNLNLFQPGLVFVEFYHSHQSDVTISNSKEAKSFMCGL